MSVINDLFSHKIHSSGADWADKLVELAFIFANFDGQVYDRELIAQYLLQVSPRSSSVRDPSKFRDEYSAYPAYFGLYHLKREQEGWVMKITDTTRKLLLQEEPDVAGFLRLQLTLFQYPNGMGGIYDERYTDKIKVQANIRDKTLKYIQKGIHLSPLRFILGALIADAYIRDVPLLNAQITYKEISTLCNIEAVNQIASPSSDLLSETLQKVRYGTIAPPLKFERRFHLLRHLGLFNVNSRRGVVKFRDAVSDIDRVDMEAKIQAIISVNKEFTGFDGITNESDLEDAISSGLWADYFDAVHTLDDKTISVLARDWTFEQPRPVHLDIEEATIVFANTLYDLKDRDNNVETSGKSSSKRDLTDPEITRIKRQRRNLAHKVIVEQIDELLRGLGASPKENAHIDLYAEIPNNGSFIFEIKSGGENLLAQIRKGISQLYEYRFRYRHNLKKDVEICLVLPNRPIEIPWMEEYLCSDRQICLCWIDQTGQLSYSELCADKLIHLLKNKPAATV